MQQKERAIPARPDSVGQGRILRLLRDQGPRSRAELSELDGMTRSRLEAELSRLMQVGLVQEGGKAASRGGRRSTLVELSPYLHFAGVDLGATSVDVAVEGRLEVGRHVEEPVRHPRGPRARPCRVTELIQKLARDLRVQLAGSASAFPARSASARACRSLRRSCLAGTVPGARALARARLPGVVDNDVNIMAIGERHGGVAHSVDDFLFVKIGTGIGCGIYLAARSTAASMGAPATSATSGQPTVRCAPAATAAASRRCSAAPRWPGTPRGGRSGGVGGAGRAAGPTAGHHRRGRRPRARPRATGCIRLIRDGGRRVGRVLAGLVSFFNPSMIVIGGGLAGSGTSCWPRSAASCTGARCRWPPATCRWCCPSSGPRPA